jgi:hypothetical protein
MTKSTRICVTGLILLIGAVAPAPAQQSRTPEAQPKKADPVPARPSVGLRGHLPESQPQAQGPRIGEGGQRAIWHRYRASDWRSEHRNWYQRGGYGGVGIPDDTFQWKFGHLNWFRISDRQMVMNDGRPRFEFGGYWFWLVDPWPEYWADNWYETDNVYIEHGDGGYYLIDKGHPDERIAVNVLVN